MSNNHEILLNKRLSASDLGSSVLLSGRIVLPRAQVSKWSYSREANSCSPVSVLHSGSSPEFLQNKTECTSFSLLSCSMAQMAMNHDKIIKIGCKGEQTINNEAGSGIYPLVSSFFLLFFSNLTVLDEYCGLIETHTLIRI